jgi:PAS domain-containing protein
VCLVNARLARGELGGEDHLEGFIADINESKLAQERLARSERFFKAIVDNALEGIIVAQDGFFVFVNPMVERMTGLDRDRLVTRPFAEFVHPDDRELVARHHAAACPDSPRRRFTTSGSPAPRADTCGS